MAGGKYRAPGMPSTVQVGTPSGRRAAGVRTFGGTPLTVDGIAREAMGSTSLLGSSVPKGIAAAAFGAAHAGSASDLTNSQADAQVDIGETLAQLTALSKGRAMRAVARDAEAAASTSTGLSVQSPRMLAHGRGPLVVILSMVPGDYARAVAMFDRYGYMVNRAMVPPRLDPMTHYSYWQIEDAAIIGDMPQESREAVAASFERGTTIWTDVSDIGTHPTNEPNAGVSY